MNLDIRRSKRESDFLPITVTAQNGSTGNLLAGPFNGKIIDISRHGARLLMTQVMFNSFHLFYSTKEDDTSYLTLKIDIPPDIVNFTIPARPIWMSLMKHGSIRAFKIGVEFLISAEGQQINELLDVMRIKQESRITQTKQLNLEGSL